MKGLRAGWVTNPARAVGRRRLRGVACRPRSCSRYAISSMRHPGRPPQRMRWVSSAGIMNSSPAAPRRRGCRSRRDPGVEHHPHLVAHPVEVPLVSWLGSRDHPNRRRLVQGVRRTLPPGLSTNIGCPPVVSASFAASSARRRQAVEEPAISRAASAASSPCCRASSPARDSAWARSSVASTSKIKGTSVSRATCAMPRAASAARGRNAPSRPGSPHPGRSRRRTRPISAKPRGTAGISNAPGTQADVDDPLATPCAARPAPRHPRRAWRSRAC